MTTCNPSRCAAAARLIAKVVLPTPPFCETRANVLMFSSSDAPMRANSHGTICSVSQESMGHKVARAQGVMHPCAQLRCGPLPVRHERGREGKAVRYNTDPTKW